MTQLYSLRKAPEGAEGEFTILKFDRDFNLLSMYELTADSCVCPQGSRGKPCRHRKLLPEFIAKGHTNDGWFLDWDTRQWREPLAEGDEHSVPLSSNEQAIEAPGHTDLMISPEAIDEATKDVEIHEPKPLDAQASGAFCVSGDAPVPSTFAAVPATSASANGRGQPEDPPTPAQAPSTHSVARADSVGGSLVRRRRIV